MGFLRFLNRFLGIFAGLILYPLKSLLVNAGVAVSILFISLYLILGSIFFGDSISLRIVVLLFSPIFLALAVAFAVVVPAIAASIDLLRTAYRGVVTGWEKGLTHVLYNVLFKSDKFSILAQLRGRSSDQSNNTHTNHAPQRQELPALANPEPRGGFLALTEDETSQAKQLVNPDFVNLVERYEVLKKKLDALDSAMRGKKDEQAFLQHVDDDIFQMDLKTPCLLFKQLQNMEGQWQTVQASTYVVDEETLANSRESNNIHPLTRENLNEPSFSTEEYLDARHCLVIYRGYCAELHELSDKIRAGLAPKPVIAESMSTTKLLTRYGSGILTSSPGVSERIDGQDMEQVEQYSP